MNRLIALILHCHVPSQADQELGAYSKVVVLGLTAQARRHTMSN